MTPMRALSGFRMCLPRQIDLHAATEPQRVATRFETHLRRHRFPGVLEWEPPHVAKVSHATINRNASPRASSSAFDAGAYLVPGVGVEPTYPFG